MPGGFPLGLEVCNANSIGIAAGHTIPNAGGANDCWTFISGSSYTQLSASTPCDAVLVEFMVANHSANFSDVTFAVGGSGSEQPIVTHLIACNVSLSESYLLPIHIPAGSRLSCKNNDGNSSDVAVRLFDGSFTHTEGYAGAEAVGYVTNDKGTALTPPGSADTKSSYIQLVASTSRDYAGFLVQFDDQAASSFAGEQFHVDIAIGGAGSEQIIIGDIQVHTNSAQGKAFRRIYGPYMIPIPSGTRIAARIQSSSSAVNPPGLTLQALYQ